MASQAFRLRPAAEADFEPMLALSIRVMRPHLERIGRYDPDRRRARMRKQFDAGILNVIEADGAMLGCVGIEQGGDAIEIHSLFLAPEAQGRGLGVAVFRAIQATHPGRAFAIEVLKESPARRFWERLGFVVTGEQPFDWVLHRPAD
ncbi:GNAT family N-acetyltransferase [Falsiroseomonas stagni]|uniref:Acetyltransferase (GNAT) family protein n=1 Tax=Falsiroseomonas stagni DSM 19981 TaxID=1123062 RepID=A0A1I3ZIQ8_9PROT|nr:GNAT family N-acetyltransferase [Falsiroseomonas stagni]SFK43476.1 Acetyltransferase (GNAT) family protein [Falsiroseomonas stagni DSM 19981]